MLDIYYYEVTDIIISLLELMKLSEYEYNALFRPSMNWDLNAAVGNNGGPYTFREYSTGFFVAGHYIFKRASKKQLHIDVIVYPMAFNYRHGIELYLKSLLLHGMAALGESPAMKKTHGILDNWNQFKQLIDKLDKKIFDPLADIEAIELMLNDFCQIDPTGQAFRYPEDIKGNQHLVKQELISLEILYESMKTLLAVFEKWSDGIAEVYEINAL